MIDTLLKKTLIALGVCLATLSLNAQTPINNDCEYAMEFKGERDYIENFYGFRKTNNFSIVGWFKTDTVKQGLMTLQRDCCGDEYAYIEINENGYLNFQFRTSSLRDITVSSTNLVNDNKWHHFAAVRNTANDSVYLYLDGELAQRKYYSRDISLNVNLRLTLGEARNFSRYKGALDEVSYWNKAISQSEVQTIMNSQLTGSESNLVLYYNFNEWQAFGEVTDVTGNGYDGDFSDPANFNRFLPEGVNCELPSVYLPPNDDCGGVLKFDGQDDYVITNLGANNFVAKDFTIETWVYIDSLQIGRNVVFGNKSSNEGFDLNITGSSRAEFNGSISFNNYVSKTNLKEKTWYHLAFSFEHKGASNNKLVFYINGFEDVVYDNVGQLKNTCSCRVPMTNMFLGTYKDNGYNFFKGRLDEFRLWSEAKNQEQIGALLNNSLTEPSENLIATFDFSDGRTADHIHSLSGKITAEGQLKNMNLDSSWITLDELPTTNAFREEKAEGLCGVYISEGGFEYSESGTYVEQYTNSMGCDSTVRIELSFNDVLDPSLANVIVDGNTLKAENESSLRTYEWYNCDEPELGVLSTATSYTPTITGNYKLHVSIPGSNKCAAISECFEMIVITTSVLNVNLENVLSVYPNPTDGRIIIENNEETNIEVEIFSITGELIQYVNSISKSNIELEIVGETGIYFVKISSNNGDSIVKKIIKK